MIRRLFPPSSTRGLAQAVRQRAELYASNRLVVQLVGSRHSSIQNHIQPIPPIGQRLMLSSDASLKSSTETAEKRIPIRRRNTITTPKLPMLDSRAEAKLNALTAAKEKLKITKSKYQTRLQNTSPDDEYLLQLHQKIIESSRELATAYSQSIKYCSRIVNNPQATVMAEKFMYEWMETFLEQSDSCVKVDRNAIMKKKWTIKTIHELAGMLKDTSSFDIDEREDTPLMFIPPPATKDYLNILRAYSASKARKKGEQAEALLANMLELARAIACDGCLSSGHKMWVNENIPTSKMFALTVKCYAGSTHKDSMDRILFLNDIHDEFTQASNNYVPGLFTNDPYVMLHSIKSLRNFHLEGEKEKAGEWLGKLHAFVINPTNKDYFAGEEKQMGASEDDEVKNADESSDGDNLHDHSSALAHHTSSISRIDVTSAYLSVIRLFARLRGEKGAAAEARNVLDQMHVVHAIMANGLKDSSGEITNSIASIDIRCNAYNLVLGMYRDSKLPADAIKASELLSKMIGSYKKEANERNGVPLPTHQSLEYTILSLSKMSDSGASIKEAERLTTFMEETDYLDNSITVYNALLSLCTKALYGKHELYDKALSILAKLKKNSNTHPELKPNPETMSLIIKACAYSKREDHEIVLDTATKIFSELIAQEESEKSALVMEDKIYFNMMLCVLNHMLGDEGMKKERMEDLFSQACQRGLCSSAILTLFRNNVSEEEFRLTVGKGRLVDSWISNVTSPKALYTDGSSRGAGKNARRHRKSTSDWAKKQQKKEIQRKVHQDSKRVRKMIKKM